MSHQPLTSQTGDIEKDLAALQKENGVLRECLSRLGTAILRVNDSLDLDVVLREIIENACLLTGTHYGAITTNGPHGQVEHFVTYGLTREEHELLVAWPKGLDVFQYFRDVRGVTAFSNMPQNIRTFLSSIGLERSTSFQGTPLYHKERHVGNFFVHAKDSGDEFTKEDEEILALFASQAAAAIAKACTYRNERNARMKLEALVDASPVGVVVIDVKKGIPFLLNREANRLTDYLGLSDHTTDQILAALTFRRADGSEFTSGEALQALSLETNDAETVRGETVELSVRNGRRISVLLNSRPICADDGTVEMLVITLQDLAPLKETERQQADSIGIVSHELRAPLTSIKGSTATVLGSSENLERNELLQFFRIIDAQADHMHGLISGLLDVRQINSGILSIAAEPLRVADLVEEARNTFVSSRSKQTLAIDLPAELPKVMADRRRVIQVLNNLFSNAARHSATDSSIAVAAHREGSYIAISVSDEGVGIAPELLQCLFQKLPRLSDYAEDMPRVTGLGLVICKGLVEAHGGQIRAQSAGMGKGARFTFTLPVAIEADSSGTDEASKEAAEKQLKNGEPVRVLVVDDDPSTLSLLRSTLTFEGFSPIVTGNHLDLPRIIRTEKPQLILMDLMLPGTDGIDVMKNTPAMADLPVIFLSGYTKDDTIARALDAGAEDYITKPFSSTELMARIRPVCTHAAALRTGARHYASGLDEHVSRGRGQRAAPGPAGAFEGKAQRLPADHAGAGTRRQRPGPALTRVRGQRE